MAEVTVLPAAIVIVVRDGPFEVLMLRGHEKASSAELLPSGRVACVEAVQPRIVGGRITLP